MSWRLPAAAIRTTALALAVVVLTPATSRAETFLTPFAGSLFGGDAIETSPVWGASLSSYGDGLFGLELDLAHAPDFFDPSAGFDFVGRNNLTTLMLNLVASVPIGDSAFPYVAAGGGLMSSNIKDFGDFSRNDFGVNIGGGILVLLSDRVGIRGDLRYFRNLSDENDGFFDFSLGKLDVWRATVGLALRL